MSMVPTLPPVPMNRERRQWTPQEDELLRLAVNREEPGNSAPSKWHAIAQHVPNRTNKDCRKRWYAKMSTDVVKGGWAPDEDQRLLNAIDCFGTRWSLVASMVQTRNSDQCAKRWCDTLNPAIDRTAWSAEADDLLIQAVRDHGTVWTKIVQMYFPGRTGLAAKNRITRSEGSSRGSSRRRVSPDSSPSPSNDMDGPDSYYPSQFSSNYSTGGLGRGQSATMSFPPPSNPSYPDTQSSFSRPQDYYPPSTSRYSSGSQYQGNNPFHEYPSLGQSQYPQQQQMQYPNPAYATSKYSSSPNQALAGSARNSSASDRSWRSRLVSDRENVSMWRLRLGLLKIANSK
ncbi:hypothetical protein DFH07DRAFT_785276 [Mycena maculata]|uniref:Uncharacterized protein n=1 Tax=Mycena maculata TaxID=230809 RepID=A0AAD7HBI3_9AGAR|nr:hypothetical protein DFH07DRAFT_785276 [Mycena maculata]